MNNNKENEIESVIIRSPNWLGDCVMAIPAIRELKKKFPAAKIYIQAKKSVAVIYEWVEEIDEILVFPDGKGWQNLALKWQHSKTNKEYQFDLGVLFTNSFSTAFWLWMSKTKRIVGMNLSFRGLFLTDKITLSNEIKKAHQAEWYLSLLRPLGVDATLSNPALSKIMGKDDDFLSKFKKPFVIIAPGSAYGPAKDWLASHFAEVADKLIEEKGVEVIITGGENDKESASEIISICRNAITDPTGKTNMSEFLTLLSNAAAFVGNDSGASHCAAAFGIPTVAIFGSTEPDRTMPIGDNVSCIVAKQKPACVPCLKRICPKKDEQNMACMKAITAEDVMNKICNINFKVNKL